MTVFEHISARLYGTAARMLALSIAGFTSAFVLFVPESLVSTVAGDGTAVRVINVAILTLCWLGAADIIWHDIRGTLIWPSLDLHVRHRVCVMLYATLAALVGLRAFIAAGSREWEILLVGGYYLTCAVGIATIAVALALEPRHGSH